MPYFPPILYICVCVCVCVCTYFASMLYLSATNQIRYAHPYQIIL